ncbi:MAG: hypothetical protein WEC84_01470 [Candidatus Andersenbacteria bacterium]
MTLATLHGRIQTKLVSYIILALISIPFSLLFGGAIWNLFAIAIGIGLILETIWGFVIEHQPGWLTLLLAALEFSLITLGALLLNLPMPISHAAVYYFVSWAIIQLFFLYVFPVFRLNWADNGSEIWS